MIGQGQVAFVEIDMPSMSMVVGNVFPFLGLIYTMKVLYNLSFVLMEVVSFFIRGRQSLRSSMQSPCGVSRGVVSFSDVIERNECGCP